MPAGSNPRGFCEAKTPCPKMTGCDFWAAQGRGGARSGHGA
jgi:hypothetical protein